MSEMIEGDVGKGQSRRSNFRPGSGRQCDPRTGQRSPDAVSQHEVNRSRPLCQRRSNVDPVRSDRRTYYNTRRLHSALGFTSDECKSAPANLLLLKFRNSDGTRDAAARSGPVDSRDSGPNVHAAQPRVVRKEGEYWPAASETLPTLMRRPCPRTQMFVLLNCANVSLLRIAISAQSSRSILGRPPRHRDFQRQYARKPRRCQRSTVSGLTMTMASKIDGKTRYSHTRTRRSMFRNRTRPALCGSAPRAGDGARHSPPAVAPVT